MIRFKFAVILAFGLCMSTLSAQQSINAAGTDGTGTGSFSISFGQILYTAVQSTSDDSNILQGVQVPYEIYIDSCPEDINLDGAVDILDFIEFNSAFGSLCSTCREDINKDGTVDILDFIQFNSVFGENCDSP